MREARVRGKFALREDKEIICKYCPSKDYLEDQTVDGLNSFEVQYILRPGDQPLYLFHE